MIQKHLIVTVDLRIEMMNNLVDIITENLSNMMRFVRKNVNRIIVGILLWSILGVCLYSSTLAKSLYILWGLIAFGEYTSVVRSDMKYVLIGIVSFSAAMIMIYLIDPETTYELVWLNIFISWTDVVQMYVGKTFGKVKISPVSPNKTLEGYIGGLVFSLLIDLLFGGYLAYSVLYCIGCLGGVMMSAVKRRFAVKDFSHILGDHGGLCDRADAQIVTMMSLMFIRLIF